MSTPSQTTPSTAATQDVHVIGTTPLVSPSALKAELPISEKVAADVIRFRDTIKHIVLGQDERLLVIVGPCSIHDEEAAITYAERLAELSEKYADRMMIAMRVYFEKPRTTVGWKGLIYDPHLNDSFDIATGLRKARRLMIRIAELGLPTATEFLDPIVPQYIADLVGWAAIGARTTESQTHRQMASGLSMPVGYKNTTTGDVEPAVNAMLSARAPHAFLGIDPDGRTSLVQTAGNRWGHVILRGGSGKPNYDRENVAKALASLEKNDLPPCVMIDCSHANSGKKHEQQEVVLRSVIEQRRGGTKGIMGLMLESNLEAGSQKLPSDLTQLQYGVSVTDACIGWDKTAELLKDAYDGLG
ncbi:MAG: 3-deoxy-7-phosphoheptulonate synthase [Phycisphaeraceae bacterium]